MKEGYPLIIVFYLDAEMMKEREIIAPFVESVNNLLGHKNANALAFFLPTKGEERIECINPLVVAEPDMARINEMIEEIKETFAVGMDIDVADEEIEIPIKPCDCGRNPDGSCKCD